MATYDLYEEYRDPVLTPQEQAVLDEAGTDKEAVQRAHIRIACRRAQDQLSGLPVLPEDPSMSIRFPGVDPAGKYCVIDMKLAQRLARADAWAQTCPRRRGRSGRS